MENPMRVFWALLALAVFGIVARVVRKPYPIVMVVGGVLVALVPNAPTIQLEPDVVFLAMLPLLLFGAAWQTDWRELRANARPIVYLAVGLVVLSTVTVAGSAVLLTHLGFAAALVLGAVLSPPDAIAVEAIQEDVPLPRMTAAILGGESLLNDAMALVIYAFAIKAVVSGTFVPGSALLEFPYVAIVGIGVGIAIAEALVRVQVQLRRWKVADSTILILISLVAPFLVYYPAEALHASGVLAVVAAGIWASRKSPLLFDADSRLLGNSVWQLVTFGLNGLAFLMIGLQLRTILGSLEMSVTTAVLYGCGISAVLIAVRFAAVFVTRWLIVTRHRGDPTFRARPWQHAVIVSWAGMRGIVTLAAALAIPTTTASGAPFPGRSLILFIAFCVIVVTLVGQGLTLPWIVHKLHVEEPDPDGPGLALARMRIAAAASAQLQELQAKFERSEEWDVSNRIIASLNVRIAHYTEQLDGTADSQRVETLAIDRSLQLEATYAQRRELDAMRRRGEINDRVYRLVEWEIDLQESQLHQS